MFGTKRNILVNEKRDSDIPQIHHGIVIKSLKHDLVVEKSNQILKRRKRPDVGEINEDGRILY